MSWITASHLNKAATDATIRKTSTNTQRTKRPKFGTKGRTPGPTPKIDAASAIGKCA